MNKITAANTGVIPPKCRLFASSVAKVLGRFFPFIYLRCVSNFAYAIDKFRCASPCLKLQKITQTVTTHIKETDEDRKNYRIT